jgi:hypothetical protein
MQVYCSVAPQRVVLLERVLAAVQMFSSYMLNTL